MPSSKTTHEVHECLNKVLEARSVYGCLKCYIFFQTVCGGSQVKLSSNKNYKLMNDFQPHHKA